MRKFFTLIAVSAMMGWSNYAQAYTKEQLNERLQALTKDYTVNDYYNIDFVIFPANASDQKSIIKLDDIYLTRQSHNYLGLSSAQDSDPNNWYTNRLVQDETKKTNTLTVAQGEAMNFWISWTSTKAQTGFDFLAKGAQINISYDKSSNQTTLKLEVDNGWKDVIILQNKYLNPKNFSFLVDDPDGKNTSIVNPEDLIVFDMNIAGERFWKLKGRDGRYLHLDPGSKPGDAIKLSSEGTIGCIQPLLGDDRKDVFIISYPNGWLVSGNKVELGDKENQLETRFSLYKTIADTNNQATLLTSAVYIKANDGKWLAEGDGDEVVLSDTPQPWYGETLSTFDITMYKINDRFYASAYFPQAFILPEGMAAYAPIYEVGNPEIHVSKVFSAGEVVTPSTGLILCAETESSGFKQIEGTNKYTVTLTLSEEKKAPTYYNVGQGFMTISSEWANKRFSYDVADYCYTFNYAKNSNGQDYIGFFKTTSNVGGYKIYLPAWMVPNTSNVKIVFDEMVTAISDIDNQDTEEIIFGLDGIRRAGMKKGINVVNGKKIVVR